MQVVFYDFGNLFKLIFEITFVFKLKKISPLNKFALLQLIIYIGNIFVNLTGHLEKNLKFDFRPYSAFIFGSRNRRPNSENFRFRPKISASGIPLTGQCIMAYFSKCFWIRLTVKELYFCIEYALESLQNWIFSRSNKNLGIFWR